MDRPYKPARWLVQAVFQEHTLTWPTSWERFGLQCPGWLIHRDNSPFSLFFLKFCNVKVEKCGIMPSKHIAKMHLQVGELPSSAADLFFNCHWGTITVKGMSNLKYYMSAWVQSELSRADSCNAPLFYLGKRLGPSFPFAPISLYFSFITKHVSSPVSLGVLRSPCFYFSALSLSAFPLFCSLSVSSTLCCFRCLYENFLNQTSLIKLADEGTFPSHGSLILCRVYFSLSAACGRF